MTFCESTLAANPPCTAWIEEGHDWHGCQKAEDHDRGQIARRRVHTCKCGIEWTTYRPR